MKLKSLIVFSVFFCVSSNAFADAKNEFVFYNGNVFTANSKNEIQSAIVVKNGKIEFVGDDKKALKIAGKNAKKINLSGNTLMPGIIDGHMHPQSGGLKLSMCSLDYAALDMAQMNAKIQKCLDEDKNAHENDWLVVINWFEQEMKPFGFVPTYKDLESIKTQRPIYIKNSFGHAALLNKIGMDKVDLVHQKERLGGIIVRDKDGKPTGRLEEAAKDIVIEVLPQPNEAKNLEAAKKAQNLILSQGVTTILDAYTDIETMVSYKALRKNGELKIRPHFAVLIDPDKEPDDNKAIAEVIRQRKMFDEGKQKVQPILSVHTVKMFLDGTIALPSLSGAMLEPYYENKGTDEKPNWVQGNNYGIKPYITREKLGDLMVKLSDLGIDSHLHADADGAVRVALDATEFLKKQRPNDKTRTAIAHAELVDPADFKRFGQLGALPVLSFQWGKPAADTWEGSKDILGQKRFSVFEPQSLLHDNGAKIVFGSDWPVDAFNQWLALEVAVTRMAHGEERKKYPVKLNDAPPLKLNDALKAMTINGAYSLHVENYVGSLEKGKFADLIVLDRNIFKAKPETIAETKVKMTMVGGKIVYQAK